MTSTRRALVFSLAERYALIMLALVGNVIIARLLTPDEIGIYSVSLAVIGVAQVLRDFGIGNFLIQENNLSEAHIRTAFGMSLLVGATLFVAVFFGATWAAQFYGVPRMADTLRISAGNFLVLPFCTISLALLRREMLFQSLVYVTILATGAGLVITVMLADANFGANSMAIGALATNALTGIGAWIVRPDKGLVVPSLSEWRPVLRFGGQSSVASVVTTISMDINELALGKMLGFAQVAMISRAQGLMNLFHRDLMAAIRNVAYPAFSRAHREGRAMESLYVSSVGALTVFAWPFYGFVALFPLEILRLMFGPQWDEAAPLVRLFCIAGAIAALSSLVNSLIMAMGRVDLVTKSELAFQPFRAMLVIGAAAAYEALSACVAAYLVSYVLYTPLIYWFKQRCLPTNYPALARQIGISLLVTGISLVGPFVVAIYAGIGRGTPIGTGLLVVAGALAVAAWFAAILGLRHPITEDALFRRLARVARGER